MPALHIRDVPPETVAALKRRAARRGHSMQQELRELLDTAAAEPLPVRRPGLLGLHVSNSGRIEPFTRDDIYGDDDPRGR